MALENGRELVIKRDSGSGYDFICGMRTKTFSWSHSQVDVTRLNLSDPSQIIQTIVLPVKRTYAFSGDGLFDNGAIGKNVAEDSLIQRIRSYRIIVPGWGQFTGSFLIGDFSFTGDMDDKMSFSASWIPAGSISFVAD